VNGDPSGIVAGPDGAVWFTEYGAGKIGRITTSGVLTEFPVPTVSGALPYGIAAGPDGALWFTDLGTNAIGRVTTTGRFTEFTIPTARSNPARIAAGPDGALWFTESDAAQIGRITTAGVITEFPAKGGPFGIAAGPDGALWFTEISAGKIGRVVLTSAPPNTLNYTITTVAGNGSSTLSGDGGQATAAGINVARSVVVDQSGNLYLTDAGRIRKVDTSGTINTVAGGGNQGLQGNQPATSVLLTNTWGVAVDSSGKFYIAETGGHNVDSVSGGIINIVSTQLNGPSGLAVDGSGNLYVADNGSCRIVKFNSAGALTVVAGGSCGYSGDNGPATSAQLLFPSGVAVDTAGNIYIADTDNSRVRKVSASGTITTVAGTGVNGSSGDGGPAISAQVNGPTGVAVDSLGNLYIADYGNAKVRKVDSSGNINTIAGGGSSLGDGGPATSAELSFPYGLAVDAAGDIFVGDSLDYRFRKLTPVPPAPTLSISSITPNSATAGTPGFTMQVTGTGFVAGSIVQWNGSALVTTFADASHLSALVPASLVATVGSVSVTVLNPGGVVSNGETFTVNPAATSGLTIITTSPLPNGAVGSAYSQALDATGGATPYKSWTVTAGSLPSGISLTTLGGVLTGLLNGVPTSASTYTFTVQVTDNAGATASKQFSLTVTGSGGGPSISANGIVNSASYAGGAVVPGEIVAIYGSGLGPNTLTSLQLDSRGYVSNSLAGTQVFFDQVAAPMIYTVANQVSAVVPYEVSGSTQVKVVYQGQSSNVVTVPVGAVLPGIFTADSSGHGQGAIVNQDGTINSPSNPAAAGSIVFLYGTGEGQTNPIGVDGEPGASPAPTPVAQPEMTATIGGLNATVQYAGGVPGLVAGVLQVNVQIPAGVSSGSAVPIQLSLGGQNSQTGVTLAVK
jgi:uncharacterized protein (TIGR03437 family)